MFIFRAGLFSILHHAPEITALEEQWQPTPPAQTSIDYALMEEDSSWPRPVASDFGWDDCGDWNDRALLRDAPVVELANHVGLIRKWNFYATGEEDELLRLVWRMVIVRDRNALIVKKDRIRKLPGTPKPCKMT